MVADQCTGRIFAMPIYGLCSGYLPGFNKSAERAIEKVAVSGRTRQDQFQRSFEEPASSPCPLPRCSLRGEGS